MTHVAGRVAAVRGDAVTQFAVLDALLEGMYSSGIPVGQARAFGDMGVGCCEGLGGEVVIVDGEFYECTADGPPRPMSDDETLPFLDLCVFGDPPSEHVRELDLAGLGAAVEERLASPNLFHAVRLDGAFARVRTRVTRRQTAPFRPLAEVAAEQIETVTAEVAGTVIGFWMPRLYQGITVAGLHLHFLGDDRRVGGHVLDIHVRDASMRVSAYARFDLRLPTDETFLAGEITHEADQRIGSIEGGPGVAVAS